MLAAVRARTLGFRLARHRAFQHERGRTYRRLLKALAVVCGIEPMVILKDICGTTDREIEAVRWMMMRWSTPRCATATTAEGNS